MTCWPMLQAPQASRTSSQTPHLTGSDSVGTGREAGIQSLQHRQAARLHSLQTLAGP